MKKLFILAALLAMPVFADDTPPAQPEAAVKKEAPAAKTATADAKVTRKQAKADCQKEGHKGADLKKCISEKLGKK